MNQPPQYMDSHQSHIPSSQSYAPQQPSSNGMSQYPPYQQPTQVLHSGSGAYAPSPTGYPQYGYANSVSSPQGPGQQGSASMGHMNPGLPSLPTMAAGAPPSQAYGGGSGGSVQSYTTPQPFDTSGQVAPQGMKPRVTATLWEDEGSMCFQVEAKGICVARRDDNHMINGTKLLNVAGMTRGRRDGILKSEKVRNVVKIGPMHLKGVWIPFERALDFANKEKITESLYPLFVHNIGALLYHPTNSSRTNAVMAAAERRRFDGGSKPQAPGSIQAAPGSQPATLTHHHSMHNPASSPHSIAPHPGAPRPGLDRAHTFPTPPTSASSTMGLSQSGGAYSDWNAQSLPGGIQTPQTMPVEAHPHSTPNTPATTPPGSSINNMQPYQGQQPYDGSRQIYAPSAPQQGQYPPQQGLSQSNIRYGGVQPNNYVKHEMGPPSTRPAGPGADSEHDHKPDTYAHSQGNAQVGHGSVEEEAEHEHDVDYPHDSTASYGPTRGPYSNYPSASIATLQADHSHISPDMSSPSHQNGSGRQTPRSSTGGQAQWPPDYTTPPRQAPSSNLYNVISDARSASNGASAVDSYASGTALQSTYAPTQLNGVTTGSKRMREDDQDQLSRPDSRNNDLESMKRRKMAQDSATGGPVGAGPYDHDGRPINRARNSVSQRVHR